MPTGEGQTLVLEACIQCHDLRAVVSQRKNAAAWRRTVNEMIWRGAPLLPGEVEGLTRYLATAFGDSPEPTRRGGGAPRQGANDPGAPPAARQASEGEARRRLPEGRGRALVLEACVGCHELGTTLNVRKTAAEWRLSVARMARLGARLNGSEVDLVASYLAGVLNGGGRQP